MTSYRNCDEYDHIIVGGVSRYDSTYAILKKIPIDIAKIIIEYYDDVEQSKLYRLMTSLNKYMHTQIWRDNKTRMGKTQKGIIVDMEKINNMLYMTVITSDSPNQKRNHFLLNSMDNNNINNISIFFRLIFMIHGLNIEIYDIHFNGNIIMLSLYLKNSINNINTILYSEFSDELNMARINKHNIRKNISCLYEDEDSLLEIKKRFSVLYTIFGLDLDKIKNYKFIQFI